MWYQINKYKNKMWGILTVSQYNINVQTEKLQDLKKAVHILTLISFLFINYALAVLFKWKMVICNETHSLFM